MNYNNSIIANAYQFGAYLMARVPVDELVMDYDYQRVETKTVADLVRHWQDEKCAPLVVNYRPDKDKFYVIDGGHRLTAAKRLHISLLPCKILIGKTKQEEARIFADQQKDVAVLTPYDRYKAALVAKDAMALKLQSIFDKYNIKVLKHPYATSGAIRCLAYCWQMVNESKAETLDWVLHVIKFADWHFAAGAYNKTMICALSAICDAYSKTPNADLILVKLLNASSPRNIKTQARSAYPWETSYTAITSYLMKEMHSAIQETKMIPLETRRLSEAK